MCHSLALIPSLSFYSVTKNTLNQCCYFVFFSSLFVMAQRGVQSTVSILILFKQSVNIVLFQLKLLNKHTI